MFYQPVNIWDFFQDLAPIRAEQIFQILDINGDGELEEDEFVSGCLKDQELITLLNSVGIKEVGLGG